MTITHVFVSAKPDKLDATKIRSPQWNAAHVIGAGTIVNADINAAAAIAESKLAFDTVGGHTHNGVDSRLPAFSASMFYPFPDPDYNIGTYAGGRLTDGVDITVRMTIHFIIPPTAVFAVVVMGGTGNMRWNVASEFSGNGEDYDTHTDSIAATDTAATIKRRTEFNITAAFTGATADDLAGVEFTREGSHANDTIGADCCFTGLKVTY